LLLSIDFEIHSIRVLFIHAQFGILLHDWLPGFLREVSRGAYKRRDWLSRMTILNKQNSKQDPFEQA
jgi:hypothetical protein